MPRVNLLVLVVAATLAGFVIVMLAGRGQRSSPAAREVGPEIPVDALSWVRSLGLDGVERLLVALFSEMGFDPGRRDRGEASVDFFAVDPTPIRGSRVYVRGLLLPPGEALGADEVRTLLDAARAESVGKAVLVTLGRVSTDAREAARDNPVDLLDGAELEALVKRYLPQAYATRTV